MTLIITLSAILVCIGLAQILWEDGERDHVYPLDDEAIWLRAQFRSAEYIRRRSLKQDREKQKRMWEINYQNARAIWNARKLGIRL